MSKLDRFSKGYLTVPVFVKRAYDELEALDGNSYRLRKGDGTKELVEEIRPLAAFLKYFERPGRSVKCRFFTGNQNYDAKIKLKGEDIDRGWIEEQFFVEVTTAVSSWDYLEREAISRYGSTFGGGDIRRVGSRKKGSDRIESRAVAQDHDAPVKNAIEWTKTALRKKNEKLYPKPCILVVHVENERPFSVHEWSLLAKEVQGEVDRDRFNFTFVVCSWSNTVFRV